MDPLPHGRLADPPVAGSALADAPLADIMTAARAVRDGVTGRRITFSPKVFIPLTMLCRDKCGYCTFAQPPARLESPYLTPEQVLRIARDGARKGCHEALFTLGERPELRYPAAADWLREHGFDSTVHYLHDMARLVLDETGLLPHANAGALYEDELRSLREVAPGHGDARRRGPRGSRLVGVRFVRWRVAHRPSCVRGRPHHGTSDGGRGRTRW